MITGEQVRLIVDRNGPSPDWAQKRMSTLDLIDWDAVAREINGHQWADSSARVANQNYDRDGNLLTAMPVLAPDDFFTGAPTPTLPTLDPTLDPLFEGFKGGASGGAGAGGEFGPPVEVDATAPTPEPDPEPAAEPEPTPEPEPVSVPDPEPEKEAE